MTETPFTAAPGRLFLLKPPPESTPIFDRVQGFGEDIEVVMHRAKLRTHENFMAQLEPPQRQWLDEAEIRVGRKMAKRARRNNKKKR